MKRLIIISVVLFFGIIYSPKSYSQNDPMFTHYMWNEMFINPAYAGSRDAVSFFGLSRQQWVGIDGAPITQSMSINGPFFEKKAGLGLSILHENIGVTNETSCMGSFAYHIKTDKKGKLAFGLSAGVVTMREELTNVITQKPDDIHFQANTPLLVMPNVSYGMYYYTAKFYVGLSIPRILSNTVTAGSWNVKNKFNFSQMHYNLISGYVFDLSRGIKLKPTIFCRSAYASPIEVSASINAFLKDCIWVGMSYRTGDAVSMLLAVQFTPNLRLGYSYDYTTSKLRKFNSGTHEISIGFDYPLGKLKTASPRLF